MDLTPDENRRIYESEKARLEAEAEIKAEQRTEKTRGCLVLLGIAVLALIVVVAIVNISAHNDQQAAQEPTNPALLAQCNDLIAQGLRTGVVTEVSVRSDYTHVVVGPPFYLIDFEAKQGFCRAIGYVSKSKGGDGNFILHDSRTNHDVGSFVGGMLNLK